MTVRKLTYIFVGLSAVLVAIPLSLAAFAG
jgi:hypothetical protein